VTLNNRTARRWVGSLQSGRSPHWITVKNPNTKAATRVIEG